MMRLLRQLLRDRRAASAAEFALVLPLLLVLMFGIIDMGRFFWQLNESEKATQMGARMAVVTTPVLPTWLEKATSTEHKKRRPDPADALAPNLQ
jgi:Flp pilus assembly protein TadG